MRIVVYTNNGNILDYSDCEIQELNNAKLRFTFISKSRPNQKVSCYFNLNNIQGFTMDLIEKN